MEVIHAMQQVQTHNTIPNALTSTRDSISTVTVGTFTAEGTVRVGTGCLGVAVVCAICTFVDICGYKQHSHVTCATL